ncbi:MAG: hypothetical protein Q7T91_02650 [Sulfuricurvum sp.]|nr:hypothetical protein [Sulfuricurvum sp.]
MYAERKKLIRYALDFEIENINTYSGYKGDLIVKITTKEKEAVIAIRKFALSIGIKEVVIKQNSNIEQFEIFCITSDENVYDLKIKELLDEVHAEHIKTSKDVWEGVQQD